MFSLFDYPVLIGGTVSGLAYVVIKFFAKDMLAGLRWLWNEIKGFVLCIVMPLGSLMIALWLLGEYSESKTLYKVIGCIVLAVNVLTFLFIAGANRGRK